MLSTIGAFIIGIGVLLYVMNALQAMASGGAAGANPWQAPSLEWATASPLPNYNFANLPVIASHTPLWDERGLGKVTGIDDTHREVLVTSLLDAHPEHRYPLPGPTIWPFLLAVTTTFGFAGSVFNMWDAIRGGLACAILLIGWFWPRREVDLLSPETQL